jgi:hypothetical protein
MVRAKEGLMTKRVLAVLPLLGILVFAMGGIAIAPSSAAPAAPSLTEPITPDVCAPPADPEFGGCRWYCGSKSYTTRSQCQANCATTCEDIC